MSTLLSPRSQSVSDERRFNRGRDSLDDEVELGKGEHADAQHGGDAAMHGGRQDVLQRELHPVVPFSQNR